MAKLHDLFSGKKDGGQRPKRVGEEIRHALSQIFMRGECHVEAVNSASITVSEVRISPDLKNATAFIMPLAGENKEELLEALQKAAPQMRHLVSKRVHLRHAPRIHFKLDNSYDEAHRINELLKNPKVTKDIEKPGSE